MERPQQPVYVLQKTKQKTEANNFEVKNADTIVPFT